MIQPEVLAKAQEIAHKTQEIADLEKLKIVLCGSIAVLAVGGVYALVKILASDDDLEKEGRYQEARNPEERIFGIIGDPNTAEEMRKINPGVADAVQDD